MDEQPHHNYRIELSVELLEDLHSGTGTGSSTVDSIQFRDENQQPCIPASHLRGVWRDNAERLQKLGIIEKNTTTTLFGAHANDASADKSQRGKLLARSLKLHPGSDATTLLWSSSARAENSRRPAEHSLRTVEYVAAGTVFNTVLELQRVSQRCKDDFLAILQFTDRLGSQRSRGAGQIQISTNCQQLEQAKQTQLNVKGTRLRLLLKNQEPLTLPSTGYAGNIINSESYIDGKTLLGALTAWCISEQQTIAREILLQRKLTIGNAYPLPPQLTPETATLQDLRCQPTPLNLYRYKPDIYCPEQANWPHWASASCASASHLDDKKYQDQLHIKAGSPKTKRPGAHSYIFQDKDQSWQIYDISLTAQMRNQRGNPFDINAKKDDSELFTVEQIPANQLFLVDIEAADSETLSQFTQSITPLLQQQVLRLGRGGAPVCVYQYGSLKPLKKSQQATSNRLRITLNSDLIARCPKTLGFHNKLSVAVLYQLLGGAPPALAQQWLGDTSTIHGFNALSGLPHAPMKAIRRGSVLELEGEGLQELIDTLNKDEHGALGERQWLGYGQYSIDLQPLQPATDKATTTDKSKYLSSSQQRLEQITALARACRRDTNASNSLSKHQLRQLLDHISANIEPNLDTEKQLIEWCKYYQDSAKKIVKHDIYNILFESLSQSLTGKSSAQFNSVEAWHFLNVYIRQLCLVVNSKDSNRGK